MNTVHYFFLVSTTLHMIFAIMLGLSQWSPNFFAMRAT